MISPRVVCWCELSDEAVQELLLLMSLYDQAGSGTARDILSNIKEKGYYHHSYSHLTYALEHRLPIERYVAKEWKVYHLRKLGHTRLRDLCELANALPSRARDLTVEGFNRARELRHSLKIYPFTNGRHFRKGEQIRAREGFSVYAILLHEDALGRRYQMINRDRDSCLPCVYVGMTGQSTVERFDEHRFGEESRRSKYVSGHGLCLMPLLYHAVNKQKMSKDQAKGMERRFAIYLRACGFAVFAGHWDKPWYRRKRPYPKIHKKPDGD